MLEAFYRIYEVCSTEERRQNLEKAESLGFYLGREGSISKLQNRCLIEGVLICDTRDAFKDIIRDGYGKSVAFAYSKKLESGAIYCVIVGEHCFDETLRSEFSVVRFKCDSCGGEVEQRCVRPICFSDWEIKTELSGNPAMAGKRFCSSRCKELFLRDNRYASPDDDAVGELWVTTKSFDNARCAGYIYRITKRSTGEVYVGQTVYAPVFRWGQHLKTDRFDITNIEDYVFETIYTVQIGENILDVEKRYIKDAVERFGDKCLNKTHGAR